MSNKINALKCAFVVSVYVLFMCVYVETVPFYSKTLSKMLT